MELLAFLFYLGLALSPFIVCWIIANSNKNKLRDQDQNLG